MTVEVGDETIAYLVASDDDIQRGVAIAREVLVRSSSNSHRRRPAPERGTRVHDVEGGTARMRPQRRGRDQTRVTRRLGWSDTQVRAATDRLVALEYLVVSGGGRGRCRTYSLVSDFAELDATAADTFEGRQTRASEVREVRSSGDELLNDPHQAR